MCRAGIPPGVAGRLGVPEKNAFFKKDCSYFSRVSAIFAGVFFFAFRGCFCAFAKKLLGKGVCFLEVFCAFGMFFVFRASARFFFVELIPKADHTKTGGNSRSARAAAIPGHAHPYCAARTDLLYTLYRALHDSRPVKSCF